MWYFKGRRKKYKSPYTGKEVDAAVAKAVAIPDTTVADAGKVLGVTPEGKIGLIEGGGGGGVVFLDTNYDPVTYASVTKDKYSFDELKAIFSSGKVFAIYIADEQVQITENEKTEDDTYRLTIFTEIIYRAASNDDPTIAVPYEVYCNSGYEELSPDIDDISAFDKSTKYFWTTAGR